MSIQLFLSVSLQEMMDRDKKDKLPNMQVGFIDSICMPVYQVRGMIKSVYMLY